MSTLKPKVYACPNLSGAWARAFLHVKARAKRDLRPLVVSIDGFDEGLPIEDPAIREALDRELVRQGDKRQTYSCKISAMTIFPFSLWKQRGRPALAEFSAFYLERYLPRLQARDSRNRRGTYFGRMINYWGEPPIAGEDGRTGDNQLLDMVNLWCAKREQGRRPRHSALQVTCFDPRRDNMCSALSGFPCLHQVGFAYDVDVNSNRLAVNAYYPTQYIFDRGYGNYLGLCHLGYFIAEQLGATLGRVNCFIGRPDLGKRAKRSLDGLEALIRERLKE